MIASVFKFYLDYRTRDREQPFNFFDLEIKLVVKNAIKIFNNIKSKFDDLIK
jgi:hypothetical protein